MKNEIDELMTAQGIDVLLVTGAGQHNPPMVYLTGGGHLTQADLIKKRGQQALLFHASMERDEAAKSGLSKRSYSLYPWNELLEEAGGDSLQAMALRYRRMFEDLEIRSGRVALYGQVDLGRAYTIFTSLQRFLPDLELVGRQEVDVLALAMRTKDAQEVEHIRQMGKAAIDVIAETANYLTGCRTHNGVLYHSDDQPLTIGHVKRMINLWLAERNGENPEGTIFAIGRDAGVPHSSGADNDLVRLGETIVFDFFPCEAGGGYYYDITRTWCLGHASDEAYALYEDVFSVYRQVVDGLTINTPFGQYQKLTCELFEEQGHPTVLSNAATEEGYVHSIGHGLGLQVHEEPFSRLTDVKGGLLHPGSVFTIEPGLYYPERGLGVRLENTFFATPEGSFEVLVDFPLDLVLPVRT